MDKFNIQDFKELMSKAADLTDSTQKVKPLFENVPNKLRDFASRTMNVLGATANISFAELEKAVSWYLGYRTFLKKIRTFSNIYQKCTTFCFKMH